MTFPKDTPSGIWLIPMNSSPIAHMPKSDSDSYVTATNLLTICFKRCEMYINYHSNIWLIALVWTSQGSVWWSHAYRASRDTIFCSFAQPSITSQAPYDYRENIYPWKKKSHSIVQRDTLYSPQNAPASHPADGYPRMGHVPCSIGINQPGIHHRQLFLLPTSHPTWTLMRRSAIRPQNDLDPENAPSEVIQGRLDGNFSLWPFPSPPVLILPSFIALYMFTAREK